MDYWNVRIKYVNDKILGETARWLQLQPSSTWSRPTMSAFQYFRWSALTKPTVSYFLRQIHSLSKEEALLMSFSTLVFWLFDVENIAVTMVASNDDDGCNWCSRTNDEGCTTKLTNFSRWQLLKYNSNIFETWLKKPSDRRFAHGASQLIKYPHNEPKFDCDIFGIPGVISKVGALVSDTVGIMRFADCQIFLFLTIFL